LRARGKPNPESRGFAPALRVSPAASSRYSACVRTLRRLLALDTSDRILIVRALGWVLLARVGLWFVPFSRLRAVADRVTQGGGPADPRRIAWAVEAIARRIPRASCLTQALAADAMLRRSGRLPDLHIGVAREGSAFEAHAWLELDGTVLVGNHDLHRYTLLTGGPK
jgi:Transglutaminase-like superfamily